MPFITAEDVAKACLPDSAAMAAPNPCIAIDCTTPHSVQGEGPFVETLDQAASFSILDLAFAIASGPSAMTRSAAMISTSWMPIKPSTCRM